MAHWRQHQHRTPKTKHEKEKCWMFWKGIAMGLMVGAVAVSISVGVAWVYIVVTAPVEHANATGE